MSALAALALVATVLYIVRPAAHRALRSLFLIFSRTFRFASKAAGQTEKRLAERNREVLLNLARENAEREVVREFSRIETSLRRDLHGFPLLQREMSELISQVETDYMESSVVPPPPSKWVEAIGSIAKLQSKGDTLAAHVLTEIKKLLERQHEEVMREFRSVTAKRQESLKRTIPHLRKMGEKLEEVNGILNGLYHRAQTIDGKMGEFQRVMAGTDRTVKALSASATIQFFVSLLVMLIAVGGAVINFNLIALPMSEMVGGGSYIGPFRTSHVAALVIILVESAMGIYLMESLRITRLFPIIGSLDDRIRKRMIWITFAILLILASIEASLAFMRDMIAADIEALRQSLAGVSRGTGAPFRWIPMAGQMVMGFILPFALAFVAIPLESLIHSSRTVIGGVMELALRFVSFLLRLLGKAMEYLGEFCVTAYDIFVFPYLWAEKLVREKSKEMKSKEGEKEAVQ
ncbi:MAG: hypothetical protein D6713_01570 [Deltaproteobacteria bacterium]|nr:MAG: hypothetical protein D6713_01570 [Deltaproteobacteria bacterium]